MYSGADYSRQLSTNNRWVLREMTLIFRCFAFCRFSQTFIDIREKERKRLQRGLVSVPPKYPKSDDDKLAPDQRNESNNGTENGNVSSTTTAIPINRDDNPNGFKPEHLLELQEKITKEILSTKLQENEMHELQVLIDYYYYEKTQQRSQQWHDFIALYPFLGENKSRNIKFKSLQSRASRFVWQKVTNQKQFFDEGTQSYEST